MDDAAFRKECKAFSAHAKKRKKQARDGARSAPFITKHRPRSLAGVVGHEAVVARLRAFVKLGRLPNMLFDGPPGVGKTTCGTCLANEVMQEDKGRGFLWLNASDDRTATFVRTTLAAFVGKMITLPAGRKRIVFLDEVDSMAPDAQRLLKRMMETASEAVTFILACNTLSRVAESLQAACALFRFRGISQGQVAAEVQRVAALERILLDASGVNAVVAIADGDMRRGLNALQVCAQEAVRERAVLTGDAVYRMCEVPNLNTVEVLLITCSRGGVPAALRTVRALADAGHSAHDVLQALHQILRTRVSGDVGGLPGTGPASAARLQLDTVMSTQARQAALVAVSQSISDARPYVAGPFFNASACGVAAATHLQLCACVARLCEVLSGRVPRHNNPFMQLRDSSAN